ncbi:hypothetical protein Dip518_000089 [Parelusimicrobium proximum]|uniref:hypothetical protein n=1 Tax=Parelusimicrobium proximum TaxID=3228953 RepID=UPI003D171A2E
MKRILLILPVIFLSACVSNMNYGTDSSTTKEWLEIKSSKIDYEGKQQDSCFKFNLKFIPESIEARLRRFPENCMDSCCWRSDGETVTLDLNRGIEDELYATGKAYKFSPDTITIKVSYSSLLNTTTAKVSPNIISRDGTVKLSYREITDPNRTAQVKKEKEQAKLERELAIQRAAAAAYAEDLKERTEISKAQAEYRRLQSIEYTRRFFGRNIDLYIYSIDLNMRKDGYILLAGEKSWTSLVSSSGEYTVKCVSNAKRGKSQKSMKAYPIDCGEWRVNVDKQTVVPSNTLAYNIAAIK